MNCSNLGFNNQWNSCSMNNCSQNRMGCGCGLGCACNPCQPCNPCNGCCPKAQPIVMPTQVQISRRVTPQEQPIIVPIERRNINHCMYIPRFYPVVQNTFFNQM